MDGTEVELIVRGVVSQLALPFTVLSVMGSPAGWHIAVRAGTQGIVRFTVTRGRPTAVRAAIQETLNAQLTAAAQL
jgi:hypothetical protein